jgi:hypothetical protein
MRKSRIKALERKISQKNIGYVQPKMIFQKDGVYTTIDGALLVQDENEKLYYQNNDLFFDPSCVPENQLGLIVIGTVS